MGDESVQLSSENLEYYIVTLFEKIETLRNENALASPKFRKIPVRTEMRTLEFWRSVICECLASFCYVFIVCGASAGAGPGASVSSVLLATSLAAGFAVATLTQCFAHISGAHINPAVSIAVAITKRISFIRMIMFIIAQCGGGIAGAAFLYGTSVPGYQTNLSVPLIQNINHWERFGVELILSFIVVLTYLVSMDTYTKWLGSSSLMIGAAYTACTFVSVPYLNPARSLGPAFVLSRWEYHWVYWIGPLVGGLVSGIVYEYMLNPRRHKHIKESADGESSSIQSEDDPYDDLDKPPSTKYNGTFNYRQTSNMVSATSGYCPNLMNSGLYSASLGKPERAESVYGGTKSLYCRSPPLTRANLNRSQSVYTKSNSAINREVIPRPGPLVPAQSLYPMRLNQQQNHLQNQNVQNQMQQRSESSFGLRGVAAGTSSRDAYGTVGSNTTHPARNDGTDTETIKFEETSKVRSNRPESMYGLVPGHSRQAQPDESNYAYYGSSKRTANNTNAGYHNGPPSIASKSSCSSATYGQRTVVDGKHVPPQVMSVGNNATSFHHPIPQHSPSGQY